jgi:hypothetical protein
VNGVPSNFDLLLGYKSQNEIVKIESRRNFIELAAAKKIMTAACERKRKQRESTCGKFNNKFVTQIPTNNNISI